MGGGQAWSRCGCLKKGGAGTPLWTMLPVAYRFKQCVNAIVFKYFNEQYPNYLNEVFDVAIENNFQLRGSL